MTNTEYEFKVNSPFFAESGPARIIASKTDDSSEPRIVFELFVLPKNKVSSNGVLYNWESVERTAQQIIGLPLHDNHRTEDSIRSNPPFGHFVDVKLKEDGLYAYADIDPEEKTFIRKVKRGDIRHCSLQIFAPKVVRKERADGNGYYDEAYIERWLEISAVVVPGFPDAKIRAESVIAESFNASVRQQYSELINKPQQFLSWYKKLPKTLQLQVETMFNKVVYCPPELKVVSLQEAVNNDLPVTLVEKDELKTITIINGDKSEDFVIKKADEAKVEDLVYYLAKSKGLISSKTEVIERDFDNS